MPRNDLDSRTTLQQNLLLPHGYSISPFRQDDTFVMTSLPNKVDAMVIHARYAHGTDIVVLASRIRHGIIEDQFSKAYFSIAPVVSWLAKSKGKPVVSCLKHDMTQNNYNHTTAQCSQSYHNPFNQMNTLLQQAYNYSELSQYHQFSQQH